MMTVDFVALGRYLNGQACQEERAVVEAWLGADAERRTAVAALQAGWAADARQYQPSYDTDAAWRRLRRGLAQTARPARSVASRWRPPAIAAGLVVLLGVGGVWWLGAHPVARPPALREYATPKGRRAVFRLLDGTEITLNADSRLGVPVRFAPRGRDVYLEGEAHFSVVHDTARPFVVHTPHSAIRAIGTRFGVHAYGDAAAERVAVAEGAVALALPAQPAAETPLRAGQVATPSRAEAGVGPPRAAAAQDAPRGVELAAAGPRFLAVAAGAAVDAGARWSDASDAAVFRRPITVDWRGVPLGEALSEIARKAGLRLTYSAAVVPLQAPVTLSASHLTVGAVLSAVLYDAGVDILLTSSGRAALVKRGALGELQVGRVVGRVTDSVSRQGIAVATVTVEGTGLSARSADDGTYRIANVPPGPHTVRAARIGYMPMSKPVTVVADQDSTVDFTLTAQATELEQVVAIGYGTAERRELTGAVSSVSADQIAAAPVTSLEQSP